MKKYKIRITGEIIVQAESTQKAIQEANRILQEKGIDARGTSGTRIET